LANSRRQVVGRKLGEIGYPVKGLRPVFQGRNEFANSIRCYSHPEADPEPPTAYERLVLKYRERNRRRHITGGFTAGQRIALDRAWRAELRRKGSP
jgi:hypothetical protein